MHPSLPPDPLTLTGGCFCSAIRYTISIPALADRPPAIPDPVAPSPDGKGTQSAPTQLPIVDLDHCESCRRACGSLFQTWIILPLDWVSFSLVKRESGQGVRGPLDNRHDGEGGEDEASNLLKPDTASVGVPNDELRSQTYLGAYCSRPNRNRTFCARCGTGVTFFYDGERPPEHSGPRSIDIALGTLDKASFETEGLRPDRHSWWTDGVRWVQGLVREGDGSVMEGGLVRHPKGAYQEAVVE